MDEWMSVVEAAQALGITPQNVSALIRSGKIVGEIWPPLATPEGSRRGHAWIVRRDSVEMYRAHMAARGFRPGPKPRHQDDQAIAK